jgi:hypothetical protein
MYFEEFRSAMGDKSMRVSSAAVLILLTSVSTAAAAEWISREGECGEWRGHWVVNEEQPGLWVGEIHYENVGGRCKPGTGQRSKSQVRAAIIGNDFFAVRDGPLNFYGTIRNGWARGEITGGGGPNYFRIRGAGRDYPPPMQQRTPPPTPEELDDDDSIDRSPPAYPRDIFRGR